MRLGMSWREDTSGREEYKRKETTMYEEKENPFAGYDTGALMDVRLINILLKLDNELAVMRVQLNENEQNRDLALRGLHEEIVSNYHFDEEEDDANELYRRRSAYLLENVSEYNKTLRVLKAITDKIEARRDVLLGQFETHIDDSYGF